MGRIKLGLANLSPEQLRDKANNAVFRMTGNPFFVTPVPALNIITDAAADLNTAIEEAKSGLHIAFSDRAEKYDILLANMRLLAAYIQEASGGNETKIISSGFEVVKSKTPSSLPPAVTGLSAVSNGYPGSADLRWNSLSEKANSYTLYATQVDPATLNAVWTVIGQSTKASFTAENLPNRNQYYWFSVVALNSAGESVMSDPAKCMVL